MATHHRSARKHCANQRGAGQQRARARAREGAVMLVVLLILLVATASAAVAVSNTQAELQASGNERVAVQTRYVAEAGLTTALAFTQKVDIEGLLKDAVDPKMKHYAEPELRPQAMAMRHTMNSVTRIAANPTLEVMPLSDAVPYTAAAGGGGSGGSAGSGGSGGAAAADDTTGSFGPHQTYGLPPGGFVVDFTDCIPLAGATVPGMSLNDASLESKPITSYSCVLTARGRLEPAGASANNDWTVGGNTKEISVFSSAHDARAEAVITQ
jgi:hypothetical protein